MIGLSSGSCPTQCLCCRSSWVTPVTGHYLSTIWPFLGYSTSTYCSVFWCNLRWRVFLYFRCLTASIHGRGKEGKGEGIGERWKGTIIRTFPPPLPFYMPVTQATSPPNIFSGVFPDMYFKPIHILCNDYFGNFWNSLGGTSWSFHTILFHQKISIISYQQILL